MDDNDQLTYSVPQLSHLTFPDYDEWSFIKFRHLETIGHLNIWAMQCKYIFEMSTDY